MKNLPALQLLAAGMTAAQPARIERNLATNRAIVDGDVLFQQYPANWPTDDIIGSYATPGVTGPAALMPQRVSALISPGYRAATHRVGGQTNAGTYCMFASATYNPGVRNVYQGLISSAGWGDRAPWGTDMFRQQASAAWGSAAARDAGAPTFRIARLTRQIPFPSPQAVGQRREATLKEGSASYLLVIA